MPAVQNAESDRSRRFEGKVVFITGAARGQGREHARRFAAEGASIIGVDLCDQLRTVPYPMATPEDLAETVRQVESAGGAMVARVADVRELAALQSAVDEGMERFGRIDVICANAGVYAPNGALHMTEDQWSETVETNLTGVWKTVRAAAPPMVERDEGGSIVITSSTAGLRGFFGSAPYVASKHAVVGLARTLALELAPHRIRVNTIHPTSTATPMIINDVFPRLVRWDLPNATADDAAEFLRPQQALDTAFLQPGDISDAVLWLASDEARWITGVALPVDAGAMLK